MNLWNKANCGLGNFKPPEIIQFHSAADSFGSEKLFCWFVAMALTSIDPPRGVKSISIELLWGFKHKLWRNLAQGSGDKLDSPEFCTFYIRSRSEMFESTAQIN
jgi:hypothetical protein